MKFPSIFLFIFLTVNAASAGPPQRLIVQFQSSLSSVQKQALDQQMKVIIQTGYDLLPHSTDQRWILVVNPELDESALQTVIEKIRKLEYVKYVEQDHVQKIFH